MITIYIKQLQQPTILVDVSTDITTNNLKLSVAQACELNADTFRLIHNGSVLKLTDQLCHYNILDQDSIMVVLKLGHVCANVCRNGGHPPPYYEDPEL